MRRREDRDLIVPLAPGDNERLEKERKKRRLSRAAFGRILVRFGLMNLADAMGSAGGDLPPD
jgi:hypothetical protein